ncbi:hypothetical protein Pst134EA_015732 [Puccinia striiformis f. sp. tritici]|uniref:hypothetical protein n=1 Tax=Puccinia striiformis f. sp. tritici TaxID=168172 RepID=UPI002008393D|nr:hypothetical protein Pst134EA_015732 [Puccinia striiformis f. sp. tritici]KAH9463647.1 hypothetical protein Pst134EA_015732 [Puccinia striiformis f. sp. tritici]
MSVDAGGKVSVGGLDKTTDSGSLQSTFGQFGEVTEAVGTSAVSFEVHPRASSHSLTIYEHTAVMQDHNTGESRGFGFVTFKQEADAHSAVQALDGQQLDGRKILVNFDRTQNGGGGGGGQRHGKNAFYDGYAYGEDGTAVHVVTDYGFGCQNQGNFNCPNDPGAEVVGSQITKNNVLGSEFD